MRNVHGCLDLAVALAALLALAACGGSAVGGPGSGGGGTGGACTVGPERQCCSDADCAQNCGTCSDGVCAAPAFGCTGGTCHGCACVAQVSQGGCAGPCGVSTNGFEVPNFCTGVPALAQCAACLHTHCAGFLVDPTNPAACM